MLVPATIPTRMTFKQAATLVFFLLWIIAKNAEGVLCVYNESCLLPCYFTKGTEPLIHWQENVSDSYVHSFYYGQSHFKDQSLSYRNRTVLSKEDIDRGNASLLLLNVKPQDVRTYKCYTSTTDKKAPETFWENLKVHAPVRDVFLEEDGERLKCESRDIFPKPSVSWSPHSDHSTNVTASKTGLFSVLSSVPLTQRPPLEHTCNISTEHSWRSATYRRNPPINSKGPEVIIPCPTNSSSSTKTLLWNFNWTQTIIKQTRSEPVDSKVWRSVEVQLKKFGDLHLKGVTEEHSGLYSCEVTTDRETYSVHTEVTISGAQSTARVALFAAAIAIVLILVISAVIWYICRNTQRNHTEGQSSPVQGNEPLMNGGSTSVRYNAAPNNCHD